MLTKTTSAVCNGVGKIAPRMQEILVLQKFQKYSNIIKSLSYLETGM